MGSTRLQIQLQPEVLRWARERVGLEAGDLARKVGVRPARVEEWEESGRISFAQADKLARHTHTPLGFLYLPKPVEDSLPIPDFRTLRDEALERPSPDLLETIQAMQRRQAWMRDELLEQGAEPLAFVGSLTPDGGVEAAVRLARATLELGEEWTGAERSWSDALRTLRNRVEAAGVLVVFNGIVGNNTHRKLDPDEFRGFALIDEYAPLIFVNGADFKAAQIFTLLHEFVHVLTGAGGVSGFEALLPPPHAMELFCNEVTAEFLVPEESLRAEWNQVPEGDDPYRFFARRFRVSRIVVARRALDLEMITRNEFFDFYRSCRDDEIRRRRDEAEGGSFWNNQSVRIGRRFGTAVARAVKEGRLSYREAYSLTGLKGKTFDRFVRRLEAEL